MSGASTSAAAVVALPAGRWSIPVYVAPAKVDASFSFVTNDCGNQSPIRISGEDSTITLYGSCGEVDVSGTANNMNLQTVAIIKATGTGNHITWEQGPGGASPKLVTRTAVIASLDPAAYKSSRANTDASYFDFKSSKRARAASRSVSSKISYRLMRSPSTVKTPVMRHSAEKPSRDVPLATWVTTAPRLVSR
jgi:Protein of unknown function (DUF3060)